MSLSQKHSGKVLVPWFNLSEWKHVYNLIFSELDRNWQKALKILKVWKHRTPLLSAGVEGTLIILEALQINTDQLSLYESSHIFSTSLMRFLNLCAANSDKQGTFYKTALQNELPMWLINIRHDIAHSHKVPSFSMLNISLQFCLEWIKEKYWDVEKSNMNDYILSIYENTVVEDAIYIYVNLDKKFGLKKLKRRLKRLIKEDRRSMTKSEIMEYVNKTLWEEMNTNKDLSSEKIYDLLIQNLAFFSTKYKIEKFEKRIPTEFLNKWNSFINILLNTEILSNFVMDLFNFVYDESHILSDREIASLWLKEIFLALLNGEKNIKCEQGLVFHELNDSVKNKYFVTKVMEKWTPFSLNFIKEILEYNNAPAAFIEDFIPLVTAFHASAVPKGNKIFTTADLNMTEGTSDADNRIIQDKSSRWTLIEDTARYMNLPLGILPHQDRNINPLLAV